MSTFDVDKIPVALVDSLKENKCGAYVGAGLSQSVGLPSWTELLAELIDEADSLPHVSSDAISELRILLNKPDKHLLLASELKDLLDDNFRKFVQRKFDTECPDPGDIHASTLALPFKYLLTTNYDVLLEHAYSLKHQGRRLAPVFSYTDSMAAAMALWEGRFFIFKLHGDAQRTPDGIVLSELDYRNIIFRQQGFQSLLQTIFTSSTMLFIGASVTDPDLKLLLSFLHSAFHGGGPTHYALFPRDSITMAESKRWLSDYNIQMILYDPADDHAEVKSFLDGLALKLS